MSVQIGDIFYHGCATMADDDSVLNIGGVVDLSRKVSFSQLANIAAVHVVSENAGDTTQSIDVYMRLGSGAFVNEVISLNGQTKVIGSLSGERLEKAVKDLTTAGVVAVMSSVLDYTAQTAQAGGVDANGRSYIDLAVATSGDQTGKVVHLKSGTGPNQIREILKYDLTTKRAIVRAWTVNPDGTTTYDIADGMVFEKDVPNEIMECRILQMDVSGQDETGVAVTGHDKYFATNNNSETPAKALTKAQLVEGSGGAVATIAYALDTALGGNSTVGAGNDRYTAPSTGVTAFGNGPINVANSQNLDPGASQGIWIANTIQPGAAPTKTFWPFQVKGKTT